jgi:hypothetical protein
MFGQDYASFGLQTGSKQFRIEIGPIERASRASTGMEQMDTSGKPNEGYEFKLKIFKYMLLKHELFSLVL